MSLFKSICYRGGLVRFDIPSNWNEEYEPEGGGTFYEDRPESGTLRLNVISISSNGKEASEQIIAKLIIESGFKPMQNDLAIKQHMVPAEERGHQLHIHRWEVAVPVRDCNARIVIFSYTMLASQMNDRAIQGEIAIIDQSVRAAVYPRE